MANYNYVPSEQVKLQQRMAEELMNTPMRQGLRGGQPTDWGRGLAHMLRQWQGGKQLREAKEQLKVNKETEGRDWDKLLAIAGNEMATSGLGPLKQDAPMESEVGKQAALSQALKRADRRQGHANDMELAEQRYGKDGAYGSSSNIRDIEHYQSMPEGPAKELMKQAIARNQYGDMGNSRQLMNTLGSGGGQPTSPPMPQDRMNTPLMQQGGAGLAGQQQNPPQNQMAAALQSGGQPAPTQYTPPPTEFPIEIPKKDMPEHKGAVKAAETTAELSAIKDSEVGGAAARAQGLYANSQRLIDKTTQLLDHPGFDTSFGASAYLDPRSHLPGTDSTDAQAIRSTIVDQIFVESLQSMRALNKSGGAVGNVSNKEGDRMENQMVAVKKAQSDEQARSEFEKLVEMQKEAQQRIKDAFRLDYGDRIPLDEIFAPPKDVKSMSDDDLFN